MNKKHLSVALSSLLVLPLLAQSGLPAATAASAIEGTDQDVVIVYKNEDGKEAALEQSTEVQHEFETLPAVSATVSPADLQDLVRNPDIAYIERNISFQIADSELEGFSSTPPANATEKSKWNFIEVAPNTMWQKGFTGAGVKVAVIDSGISPHSELKIAGGVSTVGEGTNFPNFADDNGHGTHVAGIIAADSGKGAVAGVAPGVSLYAVKALGANGQGDLKDVLEGLDWAIQNKMDIINMSLGSAEDAQSLHDMVDKAAQQGIVVVAAAGNSGKPENINQDTVNYPAKYDSVISVAAVDQNLQHASFSSAGPRVDFSAPGVAITSTYPGEKYATGDGTSQAAPHVAGQLALLKEKNPRASASVLRGLLDSYAVDLGTPGRDNLYGNGFVTFKTQNDTAAPAEVGGAAVTAASTDSLTLGWTFPADIDFKEVRVYQDSSAQPTTVTDSVYTAAGLTPDTAYEFRLTTVDTSGNESQGVKVSGRTQAVQAAPAENGASQTPAPDTSAPVSFAPAPSAPAAPPAVQMPVVATPAPSGGSAQIPSGGGGGGGGGGGAAPAPAAPAAPAPSKPAVTTPAPAASKPAPAATTPSAPTPVPSAPAQSPTAAAPVKLPFADVPAKFWGRETVAWAFERGLAKGYADGQFKPNAKVSEAEFLAMLIRTFEPGVKNSTSGTWSNTYYARAKQLGLPVQGSASKSARTQMLTRLQVAELIASADGKNYTGNAAIRYLLSSGIASGTSKTQKTIASFNGNRTLTRAEALQFLKNLTEKGSGSLK
ncbi:S8 family peptidase [Saccharibacillus alkalitolerans]|uniref:S8 family serine peptidase n=1 Tax=Saccharibacillus alkalitolerans TaxID=2705290 RepID=A0ABX0F6T2_9BACL|nr:S8 family serine peptidase [Saccharibacillus alkalitolerans]NGZ76671.1 S8 family serine peptidase [Saccharibacillus alkalitolerans]